ncbi:hypothetical protein [Nocardioides sp.]|uniref:hypothetical protein n=1 Tax=Nocardioides sp. TaxID=35761 RepID=UPI002B71D8DA|nr:hypothetical protein [Nocardioides sp.]HSX66476.1 hypothetical protein [Nocardioides sp.]
MDEWPPFGSWRALTTFSLIAGAGGTVLVSALLAFLEQRVPTGDDVVEIARFGALFTPGMFLLLVVRSTLAAAVEHVLDATLGRWLQRTTTGASGTTPHPGEEFDVRAPRGPDNSSPR